LATSGDGTIRLWDATLGRVTATLGVQQYWVYAVAWSPDGTTLATSGSDGTIRLWDATSGRVTATMEGHQHGVYLVAWSPDGTALASGSSGNDGIVPLWDTRSGRVTATLEVHQYWVCSVAWSPDGTLMATGSSDGTARIWNPKTGQQLSRIDFLPPFTTPADKNAVSWNAEGECLWASANAWVFLAYFVPGDATTPPHTLPAEYYGPLPS